MRRNDLNSTSSGKIWVGFLFQRFARLVYLAAMLFPATLAAEGVDSQSYRLAPGDRITVTVFGQPELSGDLVVDDIGTVTLPLTTPVEVKNLTLLECQKRIGERLADGILRNPTVSVRVAELRPIYVLGDVRLPGSYPFRFGGTVQSAVALAGGFGPGEVLRNSVVSEFLVAEERVHQLSLQRNVLLVRKARLEAQRDNQDTFSPSSAAFAEAGDDRDMVAIVANEKDIFAAQAGILREQVDLLRSQKPLLQEQIHANAAEGTAGKKQLDLIRQQIDRYERLVRQGLGTQNNDFQFRVLEANQEASVWRLLSEVSRLQMQAGDLDLKIQEVQAVFQREVAKQLQESRDRINELEVALPAAIKVRDLKLRYAGGAAAQDVKHWISITRTRNGQSVVLAASETTPVEPGDVIEVKSELPRLQPPDEAAVGRSALRSNRMEETQAGTTISAASH